MIMQNSQKIDGVWTAIATPFHNDGAIDYAAWERLLTLQKEAEIKGLVVSGSTGEGPTLTVTEKLSLVKRARAFLGKDLRIMGGISSSDTAHSMELAQLYEEAGADSLLVVTPPYNKPNLAGLKLHFSSIGAKVSIPICLYHVPGRTAHKLDAALLGELCKLGSVQMVKEASGDLALFAEAVLNSDASYLSGDDTTYLGSLVYGGKGVISVISNLFPKEWVAITNAYWKGDTRQMQVLHRILSPLNKHLYCESNPIPLKGALELLGFCGGYLRAPLAPLSVANRSLLKKMLTKVQQELASLNG